MLARQFHEEIWGIPGFVYEVDHYDFRETRQALYAGAVCDQLNEFDSLTRLPLDRSKLRNRHVFHQRSYLDFKYRLAGHLIADHGDRMMYANGVEGRYPFLDINLVEFMRTVPPGLQLKGMQEKYLLKEIARKYIPEKIINRQKFGFVAPGSQVLMKKYPDWFNDHLSYSRIRRQGYFNPDTVEHLKKMYQSERFHLNVSYETDLLLVLLTFSLFLDIFEMDRAAVPH
jgi:asparagine synthase (glutamine-hydrolysing)